MTSLVNCVAILLASREEMHRVWGRFDHEKPGISATQVAVAIGVIAIAIVATTVWRIAKRRAARTFSCDSSMKLFQDLCAAHGIKRSGRRLLKQLANASGVTDPAKLFVEPRYFEANGLPRELQPAEKELRTLSEMLFGGEPQQNSNERRL